jgi:hypothetical protein
VRTAAIPGRVKQAINTWMTAVGVQEGRLLRAVSKGGKVKESMSGWAVWSVVGQSAKEIGIERVTVMDLHHLLLASLPAHYKTFRFVRCPLN